MEGNLHCLKYIISNAHNMNNLITARNDQGDTPKTLAQQFYKDAVVEYLEAVEWDRDHPEQAESGRRELSIVSEAASLTDRLLRFRSGLSGARSRLQRRSRAH